ncbi:ethanolamine ammonia-lyase subunit EutC [Xenophilus arseniciresistens]|uniref:Ethanolamine ammonia-lyase small subunit n=1 Tax=Xenophilus arseniciresistens TaxID=1283306 RepID=A0AAE3N6S0_9BURK|nr:ethanolamine ammonia-lyase subunit EutC [Xenophilus arseniciresistens]MDA7416985.1 ethanolamine ammonia-lyase subunit EutC [Xenophilus arseniciresistens]
MIHADPWDDLRAYTAARLALGRAGASLPTTELLRFGFAHAQARDAVHLPLEARALADALAADGLPTLQVHSAAPDRAAYLLRPDLGRRLDDASVQRLRDAAGPDPVAGCDLLLVAGDGLSSLAVARHAQPLIAAIRASRPADWTLGPVVIAQQARVALADEVGALLGARLVAMLIGERPGLSSPDSLGLYLTWKPAVGCHDAQRNCISNIRADGLRPEAAAARFWWLAQEARRLQLTGVGLKDRSEGELLTAAAPPPSALPGQA